MNIASAQNFKYSNGLKPNAPSKEFQPTSSEQLNEIADSVDYQDRNVVGDAIGAVLGGLLLTGVVAGVSAGAGAYGAATLASSAGAGGLLSAAAGVGGFVAGGVAGLYGGTQILPRIL